MKKFEAESKAGLESKKLEIDRARVALDAEKVEIEREQQRIEELRILAEAIKAPEAPAPLMEEPEPMESVPQGLSREDMVAMFQALLAERTAPAPVPPMPPQVVRMTRTPEGIVGTVEEVR